MNPKLPHETEDPMSLALRPELAHTQSGEVLLAALGADPVTGLEPGQAAQRLLVHGPNRLAQRPPPPRWKVFLEQFRSVLVGVLVLAAVIAFFVGDVKDAVVILIVVGVNAILGYYQEHRAEAAIAALKKMLASTTRVRRGGQEQVVEAEALVPGDIVILEAGDRVPADGRVWVAHRAEVNESALTGESQAVTKQPVDAPAGDLPLAERAHCVYMNTVVTKGRLEVVVTATGMATEMGRLTQLLTDTETGLTPLQHELDSLGKRLAMVALGVVGTVLAVELLRGRPLLDEILKAVALAVAAVPEGLPAVVTVTLALGMRRMARQQAIAKKLAAVETLGCATVICSDKTGTLTENRMAVRSVVLPEGRIDLDETLSHPESLRGLSRSALLCCDAREGATGVMGDPTEAALLRVAAQCGLAVDAVCRAAPRVAELPFDSSVKYMATFHREGEAIRVVLKGAPDIVLKHCAWADAAAQDAATAHNEALAREGMRVLAVAERLIPAAGFDPAGDLTRHLGGLALLGLVGIVDPPRPEARAAIALCKQAGIRVKMITGDHALTARSIATDLGIDGESMTGAEIDALDDAGLVARVGTTAVFARVSPEHKLRIVRALQAQGEVVAMTGDGVNDAPALKAADIGVAMGIAGTEVSKEAASVVLADDNFATIVAAVKEGRTIYDNIVKFVRFQLSTNIGAVCTVTGASLLGLPAPFTAIQILWINIIMDGPPAMTLGIDPARAGIMQEPPRPRGVRMLTLRRIGILFFHGALMAAGTLAMFCHGLEEGGEVYAHTLAFSAFVFFQIFNALNARAERSTSLGRNFFRNPQLWMALGIVSLLQVAVVHWPLVQPIFRTTPLTWADWGMALGVAASILVVEEVRTRLAAAWWAVGRADAGRV